MKKSLSLLVAIAMVFSMFATVVSAAEELTTEQKYEALVEAGIFEGYDDGEAHLDREMTRAQAAKIIALLTGYEEGTEVDDAGFTDLKGATWAADYINYAAGLGILEGKGNKKFDPSANVKVQELAKIAVEILGLEVDEDAEVEGEVDAWAVAYVAAVVESGLIPAQEDYTAPAVRELLVIAAYALAEIINTPDELALASVKAVGSKKIEVNFNKAVEDTSKASFVVKKGTVSANVAKSEFNADKNVATLELSSKLTEGEYTVTVSGLTETALTGKVTTTNEKVTKIEVLSTVAPLVDGSDADTTKDDLSIPYKVTNQYGEDVTKTTSVYTSLGTANAANGVVEIDGTYKVGDIVAFTIIHQETATSVVATLTVSAESKIAELAVTGLYNKDGKTLSEDTNLSSDLFYLLVDAKDQYGMAVTNAAKATSDVIVNETNIGVVVAGAFTTVTVDGATKLALQLNNPATKTTAVVGQSTVMLISNTTGKNASHNVVVAEAARADVINLQQPELVAKGEKALIPVEAFDKDGNAITDVNSLNHATKGVKVTGVTGSKFIKNDKGIFLEIPASNFAALTDNAIVSIVAQTANFKVTTLTFTVKAAAIPTVIVGTDSGFSKTLKASEVRNIAVSNLVVEDQYGRVMSDASVQAYLTGGKKIVVADTTSAIVTLPTPVAPATTNDIAGTGSVAITAGTSNGTEVITLTLHDGTKLLTGSAADVTLRVTDGSEYTSYSVDAVGTVYDEDAAGKTDNVAYNKEVKVYGVLADGSKVQLTKGADYTATSTNSAVHADLNETETGTILNVSSALSYASDKTEVVHPITVTINKTGAQFTQDVTFSKVAPKVASVKFVNNNATNATTITAVNVTAGTFNLANLNAGASNTNIVVTDQYGVSVVAAANTGVITFADSTSVVAPNVVIQQVTGSVTPTANGTPAAAVTDLDVNEVIKVIVTYVGGASAELTVTRAS
ncbi:S-layer homology domain-containing protein [Paenibacillus sp. MY03]|uniref:S-layer homology domain-containing protein n=1 Tax=Paenibacillus sp. MY03 TaxID=302980 RepID=UPI0015C59308|nr:S-layer homology domain-containing protein [Paenibacillus sp. MY03]